MNLRFFFFFCFSVSGTLFGKLTILPVWSNKLKYESFCQGQNKRSIIEKNGNILHVGRFLYIVGNLWLVVGAHLQMCFSRSCREKKNLGCLPSKSLKTSQLEKHRQRQTQWKQMRLTATPHISSEKRFGKAFDTQLCFTIGFTLLFTPVLWRNEHDFTAKTCLASVCNVTEHSSRVACSLLQPMILRWKSKGIYLFNLRNLHHFFSLSM